MNRVIILGCGGSGKSTLARQLGEITGLRVIEIDKVFWQPGLVAMPRHQWVAFQHRLIEEAMCPACDARCPKAKPGGGGMA